jgi:hypothetical protein
VIYSIKYNVDNDDGSSKEQYVCIRIKALISHETFKQ